MTDAERRLKRKLRRMFLELEQRYGYEDATEIWMRPFYETALEAEQPGVQLTPKEPQP